MFAVTVGLPGAECHCYGPSADTCVILYADKLRPSHIPSDDAAAEHLMDVSEIVDSSGEVSVAELPSSPGLPPDLAPECPPTGLSAVSRLSLEADRLSCTHRRFAC